MRFLSAAYSVLCFYLRLNQMLLISILRKYLWSKVDCYPIFYMFSTIILKIITRIDK